MANRLSVAGLTALLPLLFAACSSPPTQTAAAPTAATPAAPAATVVRPSPPAPVAARPAPPTAVAPPAAAIAAHLDPSSPIHRERSVFFDFDESTLLPRWLLVIERQGKYLAGQPPLKVRVEGHADERGGREYNLALGQRRADAVRKALLLYGVKDAQIDATSFGEERPLAAGHDEASWSQNRRADIVHAGASR